MKKILASAIALALTMSTLPAEAEQSVVTTINRILPANTGVIDIVPTTQASGCTNANTPKRYRIQVGISGMTADGLKSIYSAILYAASFNKSVTLYFDETLASCNITRVLVQE